MEKVVLRDQATVRQTAFEAGVAFGISGALTSCALYGVNLDFSNVSISAPEIVADTDHLIDERRGRKIDDVFRCCAR
jgi:hypothetical protein